MSWKREYHHVTRSIRAHCGHSLDKIPRSKQANRVSVLSHHVQYVCGMRHTQAHTVRMNTIQHRGANPVITFRADYKRKLMCQNIGSYGSCAGLITIDIWKYTDTLWITKEIPKLQNCKEISFRLQLVPFRNLGIINTFCIEMIESLYNIIRS